MKRRAWLALVIVFALAWTALMSVDFSHRGGTVASDGSTVTVTYFDYDQTAFSQVTVYLSVLDGSGQPVLGLTQEAFSLSEDDLPVAIRDFIPAGQQPVTAVMLIDHSGSMGDGRKMEDAIAAALAFLDCLQDGRDRLGVIAFDSTSTVLGNLQQMDSNTHSDLRSRIAGLSPNRSTAYYDTIYQAVGMLRDVSGRKVVLALTDGRDNESSHSLRATIKHAVDNNVVVYTIGLGYDVSRSSLRRIADETGGRYYEQPTGSDLAQLYTDIAQGLQNEYSLIYVSPTPRLDGTRRQVEVAVGVPAGTISATRGYAVGGTLAPSLNLWLFLGLLLPLALLLAAPGIVGPLRRRRLPVAATEEGVPVAYQQPPAGRFGPPPVAAPPVAASGTCPRCGHVVRVGARFCPACGNDVAAPQAPPVPAAQTCPTCGRPVRPGAHFCPGCGTLFATPTRLPQAGPRVCPACGAQLRPGARFCARCGRSL